MNSPDYLRNAEAEVSSIIRERQPLEVELLTDADKRRVEVAAASSRPLPAGEIEELVSELRRIQSERKERQ